ncbi:MAG: hypothetical protein HYU88_12740 [Chloroflexi bacterium]|nr:hypothetical protein [Chloroflexota bacterium]
MTQIAREFVRDVYPILRCVVLIRDHDGEQTAKLHSDFCTRMANLARSGNNDPVVVHSDPALVRIGELKLAQILFGDPGFGAHDEHAVEDHILAFLKDQPTRDPAPLVAAVRRKLGSPVTPKQQVLLAMVREQYWSSAAGFYERVVSAVPAERLQALGESVGLGRVMDSVRE